MSDKQKILEILKNFGEYNSFDLTPVNTAKTVIENKGLILKIANKHKATSGNNNDKEDSIDNDEVTDKLDLNKLKIIANYNGVKYIITFSEDVIVNGEKVKGGVIMEYDLEKSGIKKHYISEKIEYELDVFAPIVLNISNCTKYSNLLKMNENNLCIIDILLRNIRDEDKERLLDEFTNTIERSEELNSKTKKLLLKCACQGGNIELFKYFLGQFSDEFYDIKNELMYYAFLGRNPEIIHILEEEGCEVDYSALKGACESGDVRLVEYIINNYDVHEIITEYLNIHNKPFNNLPGIFQRNFETEIINLFNFIKNPYIALCLIEKYDFIKNNKEYKGKLLLWAFHFENLLVIEFLISNLEIDINEEIKFPFNEYLTPLGIAIEKDKNKEVIKLLLSNPNLDINKKLGFSYPYSPLFAAILNISRLDNKIIELFLSNSKLDVNAEFYGKKGDPMTLIACAIKKKNLEVLKLLYNHPEISSKIDINRKFTYLKNEEITLSTFSICQGDLKIFEFLISKENINLAENNEQNKKMLFESIGFRSFEIFEFLYQYQANFIDAEYVNNPKEKLTPIAMAIKVDCFEIADFLLKNKEIDLNAKYRCMGYSEKEETLLKSTIDWGKYVKYPEEKNYINVLITLLKKSKIEEIEKEKEELKKIAKLNRNIKKELINCLDQKNYFEEETANTLEEILKEIDARKKYVFKW